MHKKHNSADTLTPEQNSIDIIRKLFTDYLGTTGAILQSHTFTEDAELELKIADKNLLEEIENLEVVTGDFASLVEQLEKLKRNRDDNFDEAELLKLCDEDAIVDEVKEYAGYAVVKISSIMDGDKLTDFINSEIHPYNIGGKSSFSMY